MASLLPSSLVEVLSPRLPHVSVHAHDKHLQHLLDDEGNHDDKADG